MNGRSKAINKSIFGGVFVMIFHNFRVLSVILVADEILITEDVGQNISLACNVTGQASWLKNGMNITKEDKR